MTELRTSNVHAPQKPYLEILTQPEKHYRFRYPTEGSSHGSLRGRRNKDGPNTYPEEHSQSTYLKEGSSHGSLEGGRNEDESTTYPTVQLHNYSGEAVIRCQLYQYDRDEEHPHILHVRRGTEEYNVPVNNSYKVSVKDRMILRRKIQLLPELDAREIDLNIVRLRFSAHDTKTQQEICEPVYSEPIRDNKHPSTNVPKIVRYGPCSDSPVGGKEMLMFTEKIPAESRMSQINFFEEGGPWKVSVPIMKYNIHRQFGIHFNIPPYKYTELKEDVKVFIELERLDEQGSRSEPRPFIYRKNRPLKDSVVNQGASKNIPVSQNEAVNADWLFQEWDSHGYLQEETQKLNTVASAADSFHGTGVRDPVLTGFSLEHAGLAERQVEPMMSSTPNVVPQDLLNFSQSFTNDDMMDYSRILGIDDPGTSPFANWFQMDIQPDGVGGALQKRLAERAGQREQLHGCQMHVTDVVEDAKKDWFQMDLQPDGVGGALQKRLAERAGQREQLHGCEMHVTDVVEDAEKHWFQMDLQPDGVGDALQKRLAERAGQREQLHGCQMHVTDVVEDAKKHWFQMDLQRDGVGGALQKRLAERAGQREQLHGCEMHVTDVVEDAEKIIHQMDLQPDGVGGAQEKLQGCKVPVTNTVTDIVEDARIVTDIVEEAKKLVHSLKGNQHRDRFLEIRSRLGALFESTACNVLHWLLIHDLRSFKYMIEIASILRFHDALNEINDRRQTVLHVAILKGIHEVVPFLIEKGCDPAKRDMFGFTAIHLAVKYPYCLEWLLAAVRHKDASKLKLIFESFNEDVNTPLHLAVSIGTVKTVETLLQYGADPLGRRFDGLTTVHRAVLDDNLAVLKMLRDYVPVNDFEKAVNSAFYRMSPNNIAVVCPLQIVCLSPPREHTLEILRLLLEAKANPCKIYGAVEPAWKIAKRRPDLWAIVKHHVEEELLDHSDDEHGTDGEWFLAADDGA